MFSSNEQPAPIHNDDSDEQSATILKFPANDSFIYDNLSEPDGFEELAEIINIPKNENFEYSVSPEASSPEVLVDVLELPIEQISDSSNSPELDTPESALAKAYEAIDMFQSLDVEKGVHQVSQIVSEVSERFRIARKNRSQWQFFTEEEHKGRLSRSVRNAMRIAVGGGTIGTRQVEMTDDHLRNMESDVAQDIFGPVPENARRGFFLNEEGFYFFMQVLDFKGEVSGQVTIHYEPRDEGILKICSIPGIDNQFIDGEELANFEKAVGMYYEIAMKKVYGIDVSATDLVAEIEEEKQGMTDITGLGFNKKTGFHKKFANKADDTSRLAA